MFDLAVKKLPHVISFSLAVMLLSACSEHPNTDDKTVNMHHTQSTPQQLFALEQVSLSEQLLENRLISLDGRVAVVAATITISEVFSNSQS